MANVLYDEIRQALNQEGMPDEHARQRDLKEETTEVVAAQLRDARTVLIIIAIIALFSMPGGLLLGVVSNLELFIWLAVSAFFVFLASITALGRLEGK